MKECKIIALGTGEYTIRVIQMMKADERINLLGVICDSSVSIDTYDPFVEKMKEMHIKVIEFVDEELCKADLIFSVEYRRLISEKYVQKYHFVNCHGGILPKYKGMSTNAWAIMNGESQVGYTIHRMDEKMDSGDIYHVGRFEIEKQQTYADVYDRIFDDMVENVCDILIGIHNGKIRPQKQEGAVVYCSRFSKEMGDLKDFGYTSQYIRNLYRCMARPHGTGVYFFYKKSKYYVENMMLCPENGIDNYIGISGKVVNCEKGGVWVKTLDNIVILTDIRDEKGSIVAADYFHIGNQLG